MLQNNRLKRIRGSILDSGVQRLPNPVGVNTRPRPIQGFILGPATSNALQDDSCASTRCYRDSTVRSPPIFSTTELSSTFSSFTLALPFAVSIEIVSPRPIV